MNDDQIGKTYDRANELREEIQTGGREMCGASGKHSASPAGW